MDYINITAPAPSYLFPPEIVQYTETQARFLPIRITINNEKYAWFFGVKGSNTLYLSSNGDNSVYRNSEFEHNHSDTINVNDCVVKCQDILGLKINEIAKLCGVSRATLDLHRKGANVKDMAPYHSLFSFVSKIEKLYGNSIKGGMRNVLVERKTLAQHFMNNLDNLNNTFSFVEEVSEKIQKMNIVDLDIDKTKLNLRLSGIGKMV
ncbi:hypothetical protein [Shewanella scandinavica]|uniref:hypothetical protein n=1 Tax=Shewanella scandinavica TaxID=3063538 RepID=UPI003028CD66